MLARMSEPVRDPAPYRLKARTYTKAALALVPVNFGVFFLVTMKDNGFEKELLGLLSLIALAQLVLGILGFVAALKAFRRGDQSWGWMVGGLLAAMGAIVGWLGGMFIVALASVGGAWGRPLRIRGRQLHPSLKEGADWTEGPRPDPRGLDEETRRALEALWLHDAQKEHASVPAFARVSWLLAAAGAPAELLTWSHRAAIEEIAHTRACFALAAGYGGRSYTVEPMPDLLLGGLDGKVDPRVTLAEESLADGCQLEDFNADVAAACAAACEEPATRAVLEQIAREERTHADFSWAVIEWLLDRHREVVDPAIEAALAKLDRYPRPTAVSEDKLALVRLASPERLRAHGRLPDQTWGALWDERLLQTRLRMRARMRPLRAAA